MRMGNTRRTPRSGYHLPLAAAVLMVAMAIVGVATNVVMRGSAAPIPSAALPSPLIFGTNLGLFDSHDQVANEKATRSLLRQEHMAIIRMPFRASLPDSVELQALQAIKAIGAAPLVIVHGATDVNALADDTHLIGLTQSVFGSSAVYVEFGNEEDLAGVSVSRYTQAWNQVIPHLKALAPTYKFIGPVNFQYNPSYIAAFDLLANPRPDFNSWHEYVCGTNDSDSYCLQHIANLNTHIQRTNIAVQAAIGTTLPFMITEWNLDPQQDPRYGNSAFMTSWTTSMLQTLVANARNGLYAAMQYCATNNQGFNLIDGTNTPTPEGQVLFRYLASSMGQGAPPTATQQTTSTASPAPSSSPSPTPRTGPTALAFSFEDGGTDGWSGHGRGITRIWNSTALATDGKHSLAIDFRHVTAGEYPYVAAKVHPIIASTSGTLEISVYMPQGVGKVLLRPFVMDEGYSWLGEGRYRTLVRGWNHITVELPSGMKGGVRQIGVQFTAAPGTSITGTVYLDDVRWS